MGKYVSRAGMHKHESTEKFHDRIHSLLGRYNTRDFLFNSNTVLTALLPA